MNCEFTLCCLWRTQSTKDPGGDENIDVENKIGTQRRCQWKQKMFWLEAWGDAVYLRLASLFFETDIIINPAFRESGENTTLGYTVIRAEKKRCKNINDCQWFLFCSPIQQSVSSPVQRDRWKKYVYLTISTERREGHNEAN